MHADPPSGMGDGGDGVMGGTTVARSWALQYKLASFETASRTDSKTCFQKWEQRGDN